MNEPAGPGVDEAAAWLLAHPETSDWLKTAVPPALTRAPAEMLNDLEILIQLVRLRRQEPGVA